LPLKTLSSTHLQLQTERCLQKASSSNHWNISIQQYRIVFCSNYWNPTCQIRNVFTNETETESSTFCL